MEEKFACRDCQFFRCVGLCFANVLLNSTLKLLTHLLFTKKMTVNFSSPPSKTLIRGLVLIASLATPLVASAQTNTQCRGRALIDAIYQSGMGDNRYEYFVQVRNQTSKPMKMELVFSSKPNDVTLFSPSLPGIALPSYGSKTIRFGYGKNSNINSGTVTVSYDVIPAGRAAATLRNCQ